MRHSNVCHCSPLPWKTFGGGGGFAKHNELWQTVAPFCWLSDYYWWCAPLIVSNWHCFDLRFKKAHLIVCIAWTCCQCLCLPCCKIVSTRWHDAALESMNGNYETLTQPPPPPPASAQRITKYLPVVVVSTRPPLLSRLRLCVRNERIRRSCFVDFYERYIWPSEPECCCCRWSQHKRGYQVHNKLWWPLSNKQTPNHHQISVDLRGFFWKGGDHAPSPKVPNRVITLLSTHGHVCSLTSTESSDNWHMPKSRN